MIEVARGLDVGCDTASLGGEDPTSSTNFPLLSAFFDLVVVFLRLAGGFPAASADLFFDGLVFDVFMAFSSVGQAAWLYSASAMDLWSPRARIVPSYSLLSLHFTVHNAETEREAVGGDVSLFTGTTLTC